MVSVKAEQAHRYLAFKKVPVLLRAFAAARSQIDPAPALLMWGDCPGECEGAPPPVGLAAELGIHDDVFFIGWRGHDELSTGLNRADLMVAPAVNEPIGMSTSKPWPAPSRPSPPPPQPDGSSHPTARTPSPTASPPPSATQPSEPTAPTTHAHTSKTPTAGPHGRPLPHRLRHRPGA
ncbi:glycosyltransferase [Streptomyces violaceus]|uniref:glycosyltransferase n=1 Tax=Streptomyces violaceus TaxID=1936 RepID=UPI003CD0B96A